MTAAGFAIFCVCCMIFKNYDIFFWNQNRSKLKILESVMTAGLLLFVAGFSVFLWEKMP